MAKGIVRHDLPDAEYFRECFDVDFETGTLTWRVRPVTHFKTIAAMNRKNTQYAGKRPTYCGPDGYLTPRVNGTLYRAHRIIWLLAYGEWPQYEVDHLNGIRDDNRLVNLREATHTENACNAKRRSDNTSGVTGVTFFKRYQRWMASITVDQNIIHLGYFDVLEDAAKARRIAERHYGFHSNHGKTQLERITSNG